MLLTTVEVAVRECEPIGTVLDWIDMGLTVHEGPNGEDLIDSQELVEFLADLRLSGKSSLKKGVRKARPDVEEEEEDLEEEEEEDLEEEEDEEDEEEEEDLEEEEDEEEEEDLEEEENEEDEEEEEDLEEEETKRTKKRKRTSRKKRTTNPRRAQETCALRFSGGFP